MESRALTGPGVRESTLSTRDGPTPVQGSWICHQYYQTSRRCRTRPLWGPAPAPQPVTRWQRTIIGTSCSSNKVCSEQLSPKAHQEGICYSCLPLGWQQSKEMPECSLANREGWEPTAHPRPLAVPQLLPTHPPGSFCETAAPTGGKGPSPGCISLAAQPSGA